MVVRVFMTDLNPTTLQRVFPVLHMWFAGAQPCVTGVGVTSLAAPDLQIEMELTVRIPN